MSFSYTFTNKNNILNLKMEGDLFGDSVKDEIILKADNFIEQNLTYCIIDLSETRFINSSGITILIMLLTKFRNSGGELVLLNPSEHIRKMMIMTKIDAIFTVANSYNLALELLK